MRKYLVLSLFLALALTVFAATGEPGDETTAVDPEVLASDGGGGSPDEPFEIMADTTADIYIYVTLRAPIGPPADSFWIELTDCTPGAEFIRFKSTNPPGGVTGDFYIMYRAPWGLFDWSEIWMFGRSDTCLLTDAIDDPFLFSDRGQYRWTGGQTVFDYFYDDSSWICDGPIVKGTCDPDRNWFYTIVGVDTNETTGDLNFSPTPADPVGEFDQWIGNLSTGKINILSYAVENRDIADHGDTAKYFGQLIDSCASVWKWDAPNQVWVQIAIDLGFPVGWISAGTVKLGQCYLVELKEIGVTPADTFMMSLKDGDGYLPRDTCFYLTKILTLNEGFNYFAMPYQEYNILLSTSGSFPLEAKYVGEDIQNSDPGIQPVSLWKWDPFNQVYIQYAINIGIWINPPGKYTYPGEPYMVIIQGDGGYWPVCP